MKDGVTLVKLGGSLLTDKTSPGTARPEVIRRLAEEIAAARRAGVGPIVVGHGSGSFGHAEAAAARVHEGLAAGEARSGACRTQRAAHRLHALVADALEQAGALPFSLLPGSWLVAAAGRTRRAFVEPVSLALEHGFVPVVCGDVVLDRDQGVAIASTEQVFAALARRLRAPWRPARALWVGATDGVLDPGGIPLPELDATLWRRLRPAIEGAAGTDVTGGIRLRVGTALDLAARGVSSWIGDGSRPGALREALLGKAPGGTEIPATART